MSGPTSALDDAADILDREARDIEAAYRKVRRPVPPRGARSAAIKRATAALLRDEAQQARARDEAPLGLFVALARVVLNDAPPS